MVNFRVQAVKGQGHRKPKLDLETGKDVILDPVELSRFYSF